MSSTGSCAIPSLVCSHLTTSTPTGGFATTSVDFTVGYRGSFIAHTANASPSLMTYAEGNTAQAIQGIGTACWNGSLATFTAPQDGLYDFTLNNVYTHSGLNTIFTLYYAVNDFIMTSNWSGLIFSAFYTHLVCFIPLTLKANDRVKLTTIFVGPSVSVSMSWRLHQAIWTSSRMIAYPRPGAPMALSKVS